MHIGSEHQCGNDLCALRDKCKRYSATSCPKAGTVFLCEPFFGYGCDYFLPISDFYKNTQAPKKSNGSVAVVDIMQATRKVSDGRFQPGAGVVLFHLYEQGAAKKHISAVLAPERFWGHKEELVACGLLIENKEEGTVILSKEGKKLCKKIKKATKDAAKDRF